MTAEHKLISALSTLKNERQIAVIGSAVIDVIADAYSLPYRGSDIELHQQSVNVGGCALNVAIAVHRLGLQSVNALPIGEGTWAEIIRNNISKKGIHSILENPNGDNGWCLALVEPDGERTFLSVSGVETQWSPELLANITLEPNALVYMSGYQLSSSSAAVIVDWLESLDNSVSIYIDFGPRIADMEPSLLARLLSLNVIITLNRQEAEHVQTNWLGLQQTGLDVEAMVKKWHEKYAIPLVIRVDKEGAFYSLSADESGWVAAFSASVVDTIGAGDSHAGGVLAGMAANWPLSDAVQLGNAVASFVVSRRGGDSAPLRTELTDYLAKY